MTIALRRRLFLCAIFIAVLSWPLNTSAQEGSEGPSAPPSPEAVTFIYETRCANCHGPNGQGDGPSAIQANLPMPDLTNPTLMRETTPARWFDIISNGAAEAAMPPFGEASSNPLRQVERWDMVFYLYTLSTSPAQVTMGQALYEMHCVECHGADGSDATTGTDFTDLSRMANVNQAALFASVADTTVEGHDLGLGEVEIWAVTDYVRTFSYNYASPAAASATPAVLEPFSGGEGVVSGRVINGTAGAAPPEGLEVRLRAFDMNADFVDAITTTIAADGAFRFEGIDPTAPVQLEPLVVYHDVAYFGDLDAAMMLTPGQPQADMNITVYETTADDSAVRIERLHIIFDFTPGQVQVVELYILSNDGDRAYVGTLERGTVRLTVPAEALSFQPGEDPARYLTLADGIADTAPILPGIGTAETVLVYELTYDGELELSRPIPYAAQMVNVFVPQDGIEVSGDGIQAGGPFQTQGATLQTYLANDLPAGERLTLRVSGEAETSGASASPSPHRSTGPNETQSIALGSTALISALAFAFLYWQGHLKGLKSSASDRQSALLQAIADLDDDFEAGRVKRKPYRARRAKLKEELILLMEEEHL